MPRRADLILAEIEAAIDGIEHATARYDVAQFSRDWTIRHAVQRASEIISEASRHLPAEMLARHPDVPWRQIRDMGNVLRHAYHAVDDDVIWSVVKDNLPTLRAAIHAMKT